MLLFIVRHGLHTPMFIGIFSFKFYSAPLRRKHPWVYDLRVYYTRLHSKISLLLLLSSCLLSLLIINYHPLCIMLSAARRLQSRIELRDLIVRKSTSYYACTSAHVSSTYALPRTVFSGAVQTIITIIMTIIFNTMRFIIVNRSIIVFSREMSSAYITSLQSLLTCAFRHFVLLCRYYDHCWTASAAAWLQNACFRPFYRKLETF